MQCVHHHQCHWTCRGANQESHCTGFASPGHHPSTWTACNDREKRKECQEFSWIHVDGRFVKWLTVPSRGCCTPVADHIAASCPVQEYIEWVPVRDPLYGGEGWAVPASYTGCTVPCTHCCTSSPPLWRGPSLWAAGATAHKHNTTRTQELLRAGVCGGCTFILHLWVTDMLEHMLV